MKVSIWSIDHLIVHSETKKSNKYCTDVICHHQYKKKRIVFIEWSIDII